MKLLVTGGGGQLGAEFAETAAAAGHAVHPAARRDLDIADPSAVNRILEEIAPDALVNCAAWTKVDDAESQPDAAFRANALGPRVLAAACAARGILLVHVSTDYVFDGTATSPVDEWQRPNPRSVYGASKLAGETEVRTLARRHQLVRTSWLYGPGKQSFLATVAHKLKRGETVQAISDTWASTTYVEDLATRVLEIVRSRAYGTHHVVNDGVCSYETFARRAAELAGIPDEIAARLIEVVSEADMKREAPRPPWTPMRSDPPLRHWEDALAAYVSSV